MIKIAVFASGRGSNFQTIYHKTRDGYITAQIGTLITDNLHAGAIEFAKEKNLPVTVVRPKDYPSVGAFGDALLQALEYYDIELVVLAGYLKKIPENVVAKYANRIVNIHPALLPAFGGKGMYGKFVHEAVYRSGVKFSGVTIHLVTNEFDTGPIVLQKIVNIEDCHSPAEIARKVLTQEHLAYPEALKLIVENEMKVNGNRVEFQKNDA